MDLVLETFLIACALRQFRVPDDQRVLPRFNTPEVAQSGELTVRAESAGIQSIPRGASRVVMLTLRLTASCAGDVPVSAITVRRRGLGSNEDIAAIYAVGDDGRRLTRGQAVSRRNGIVELRPRSFTVPKCGIAEVTVLADFAQDAAVGGEHRFEVGGVEDIEASGARVSLEQDAVGLSARRTAGASIGTVTVSMLPLTGSVRYGDGRTVARLRISADGADRQRVRAITLTNEGTAADGDLERLFVETGGGRRISDVLPALQGNRARFTFGPPFPIERNRSVRVTVRADVRGSVSRTVRFIVEESGDIEAEVVRGRE